MFDEESDILEVKDAILFYEELMRDVASTEPGSAGHRIRTEVLESDDALRLAIVIIARDQMWEEQIDPYGRKMPRYKPDTVRKKAKLPDQTPDKLVNYTQMWTGRFYLNGIYVWVDGSNLDFRFEKTDDYEYFQYIPDEYIGMTDENFEEYQETLSEWVTQRQREYVEERLEEMGYSQIIHYLELVEYDFNF